MDFKALIIVKLKSRSGILKSAGKVGDADKYGNLLKNVQSSDECKEEN